MARPTKEQRLADLHAEAVAEFGTIIAAVQDERERCLSDRRFYSIAGAQWEGDIGKQFENRPKFEVNKVHLSVIRIFNEYRNNRITVDFVPKDGAEDDALADACDGLYRADEQDSGAEEAYDNAFEEAVGGGFGAWRLCAEYENDEDPEDERQRIRIEPIFDADSTVFFDLQAKRQDKADATRCFVLTPMSPAAYKEEYDDDPATWPQGLRLNEFDWATPDVVFVAEYYRVESRKETVQLWEGLDGEERRVTDADIKDDPELEAKLAATGFKHVRDRKIVVRQVHKYILSGGGVLEDCGVIAGKCIPIVPMYGKRWFVDGVERCMGHVRLARDSQVLGNMQRSTLGELSATSPLRKPIFVPEQVAGHQNMWSNDSVENYPYLLVNPITDINGQPAPAGPVGYLEPPTVPPALAALLQVTEQDMQDLLGNQQAGEQLLPNMSGKAVELVQNRLDMQTFIYMSNMAKAVKRSGEIWLSMAKDILVEEGRRMKTIGSQGEVGSIEILRKNIGDEGETVTENDFGAADLDVAVEVGPSSSSKRAATVRALTGMASISDDPETRQVLTAMAMMNMEGEGLVEIRKFFRKRLLAIGAVEPTEEEKQQMLEAAANKPEDPNSRFLAAAAAEAEANAKKANADTVYTVARAEKTQADTEKTYAETAKIAAELPIGTQRGAEPNPGTMQ